MHKPVNWILSCLQITTIVENMVKEIINNYLFNRVGESSIPQF